jgi:hypothetical protein
VDRAGKHGLRTSPQGIARPVGGKCLVKIVRINLVLEANCKVEIQVGVLQAIGNPSQDLKQCQRTTQENDENLFPGRTLNWRNPARKNEFRRRKIDLY